MSWQSSISGTTHETARLCQLVHRQRVCKIRVLLILGFLSEVVISHVCFLKRRCLTWRQEICNPACQAMRYEPSARSDIIRSHSAFFDLPFVPIRIICQHCIYLASRYHFRLPSVEFQLFTMYLASSMLCLGAIAMKVILAVPTDSQAASLKAK